MTTASRLPPVGLWLRLVRKELAEILRDRRTILTLVLMPLLLYPLLAIAFRTFLLSNLTTSEPTAYIIGIPSGEEGRSILHVLTEGQRALAARQPAPEQTDSDKTGKKPPPHIQPLAEMHPREQDDLENAVRYSRVHVGIRAVPARPFNVYRLDRNLAVDLELLYREDSSYSVEAVRYLERVLTAVNLRFLSKRLNALRIGQRELPLRAQPVALPSPLPQKPMLLPGLVPLILILMTITGAVYPAIDVTAGERERGTLEILISAPVPRMGVLFAKYVAVLVSAMLTALVNLGTMTVTLYVSGVGETLFGSEGLSPLVFVRVLGLLLLFAAFFSAVLLTLTSFARSFKEAQAYLVPLMLVALMPGILSLLPGMELQGPLAIVPLLNVALLTRDLLEGNAHSVLAVVVVTTTLLYALAALALAARIFGAEAVLYSQQGGWSDLFNRTSEPQPTATPTAALLCAALLFPSTFLVNGLLARLDEQSLAESLTAMAVANALLFGGYPLLAAWWGRVRWQTGFRLGRPGILAWPAVLLLGLCLWPWVHEITLLLRSVGIATLRPEHLQRLPELLEQWRTLPPAVIVLVLALLPAVLEEFFFRGYVFSALRSILRPGVTILTTAALFAVFHLILGSVLAVERFVPSFLLGLVLGWVCWKTGSVWPGMLLHALHNGCVVLLGYYQPKLAALDWSGSEQEHLSLAWLAIATVGATLGFYLLTRLRRRDDGPSGTGS